MKRTVFERYGGFAKVSKLVLSFYDRMLDSPLTALYFANPDMKRLIDYQTKFFAYLMGGPASYTNEHIERVHAHLGIKKALSFMQSRCCATSNSAILHMQSRGCAGLGLTPVR